VLNLLERTDEALWFAGALSACAESGLIRHLEKPSSPDEAAQRLALDPAIVAVLTDILIEPVSRFASMAASGPLPPCSPLRRKTAPRH
jgi:hypothetical protein